MTAAGVSITAGRSAIGLTRISTRGSLQPLCWRDAIRIIRRIFIQVVSSKADLPLRADSPELAVEGTLGQALSRSTKRSDSRNAGGTIPSRYEQLTVRDTGQCESSKRSQQSKAPEPVD